MTNNFESCDSAEIAAAVNMAASALAKGKTLEELELLATFAHMFSETLHAIARVERRREQLRRAQEAQAAQAAQKLRNNPP
jgi:hypothetical protein